MAFWASLFGKRTETIDLEKAPTSAAHLRTQVFRADYLGMRVLDRSNAAMRVLAPGLVEVIVEDLGAGERTLGWDALKGFGSDRDELFALARKHAAACEKHIERTEVAECVEVLASNGFYLSAYLLEAFAKREQKKGVLFVPVSWHHWCVHIIGPLTVAPIVPMLELVASQVASMMKVTDAERLVQDVYWYKPGGVIEKLELTGDGGARIATSPELAKALEYEPGSLRA